MSADNAARVNVPELADRIAKELQGQTFSNPAGADYVHAVLVRAWRMLGPVDPAPPPYDPKTDAMKVADFIVGGWPGLEDGIDWGVNDSKENPVFQAAKRLLAWARKRS